MIKNKLLNNGDMVKLKTKEDLTKLGITIKESDIDALNDFGVVIRIEEVDVLSGATLLYKVRWAKQEKEGYYYHTVLRRVG